MTSALPECPEFETLQALLSAPHLPAEEEARFERHLQGCASCQARIDRAEEGENSLRVLARQTGDPTVTPLDPTLAVVVDRLHEARSTVRTAAVDPADLYFLSPPPRPGLLGTMGNYEVREVIGQGGMGVVLKAFDPALHRLVAIKVLSPALAGSGLARKRFTREAQAAAAVCHEHVVAVHGVHEASGLPYLVMQFVAGESLQERLDRVGFLEVAEVVRIGMQTAQGLAAAHAQGLIHRDIKPANLLLEGEPSATGGRIKITDFGLARMADDAQLTRDGVVAGTPEYMAPEQSRGEAIDHRGDLFSLGSVLYAMCTGRPPFRAATAVAVLRQVSDETPPAVRVLNPEVPAWLAELIERLMDKDPARRLQSASEVAALLEGYLAHLRQPVTVPAPALSPLPPVRRAPLLSRSALAALAALVLVAVGFVPLLLQTTGAPEKAGKGVPPPVDPPADKIDVWSVAISPDGKYLAAGSGRWDEPGEIGVWSLATREPLQRFTEELGVASLALSPDGKLLASGSWSGHVRVFDWAAGRQLFDFPVGGVARVAFSPDGQLLAAATEDRTAHLWDVATGKLVADLQGELLRFHCVTFSPDGSRVLAGGGTWKPEQGPSQVTVWDVASKKQVLSLIGHSDPILSIAFSPDGKTIATGSVDASIRLWDADSGRHLKTLSGHRTWVESVVFTADGKTLLSASPDRTIRFWDVEQGQQTRQMDRGGPIRTARFTPDGKTLVFGGGRKTLKLLAMPEGKELAALWDGAAPRPVAMDLFPVATPTKPGEKRHLRASGLVGLGLALLASLGLAAGLTVRRLRGKASPAVSAGIACTCPACGKSLKAKAALAGKKVKCPKCGQPAPVPDRPQTEAAPPARRRAPWDVLAALTAAGAFAALLLAGLSAPRESAEPEVSRLQLLADRVRAVKTDTIDARPYPSVTDKDLAVLVGLEHLRKLNLDHTQTTDAGLKEVAQARGLVQLSLTNTQVTEAGLAELAPLTALEDLRLDKLPISDAGLAHLSAFPRLTKLSLYQTGVTGNGLVHLARLPALEHLSLDDTQVDDEGLRHLKGCTNLKRLSVWKTQVTPAGVEELKAALPKLKVNR